MSALPLDGVARVRMRLPAARGPRGFSFAAASAGIAVGHRSTRSKARHTAAGEAEVETVCVTLSGKAIGA